MTIDAPLLADLQTAAAAISSAIVSPQAKSGAGKIYELWLLFKLAEALRQKGYHIEIRGANDKPTNRFIQRGSPGSMKPTTGSPKNPSFILFRTGKGEMYEIHNSLQFIGRSGAAHEFDIAILGRELAEWLRGHGGGRPEGHPRFSIECKQYGSNVHVGVMRDTFGQLIDGTFLNGHIQYLGGGGAVGVNSWQLKEGSSHHSYKAEFSSCFIGIVATAAFSNGAATLSDHHQFQLYDSVIIGSPSAATFFADAVKWIRNNLGGP